MSERESLVDARVFSVTWYVNGDMDRRTAYGATPRRAVAAARRLRRDYWICGKDPGWITTREQWHWMRLARRIGLV